MSQELTYLIIGKCTPLKTLFLSHNCSHQFNHQYSMPLIAPHFQLCNLCVENSTIIATVMCQLVLETPNVTQQQQQMFVRMWRNLYSIISRNPFLALTKYPGTTQRMFQWHTTKMPKLVRWLHWQIAILSFSSMSSHPSVVQFPPPSTERVQI